MKDLPEEIDLWKEKIELENAEDESDDPFIPAQLAEPDDRPPLIHVDL
jgi:hypothetical protein